MSNWTVILLGIIEGVTEFLPVSSTGHLLLAEQWLKLSKQPTEMFNVVIQSGAVMAVLLAFAGRLKELSRDWRTPMVRDYVAKLAVAFAITGAGGLILKKLYLKMPETAAPVAWATLIGGVVILLTERSLGQRRGAGTVAWPAAIAIGCSQLLAISFPGTSRSGASIIVGLLLGLSRPAATEFSFLLGVPTLLAASGYELLRHGSESHEPWSQLVLGTVVAAVTAFLVVRWLLNYVQNHTFLVFGWYRVILGGFILLFVVFKHGS
jgi:undecaprenyl-diphosphatase